MEENITMTKKQQKQFMVLSQLISGSINNKQAADQLGLSVRQIQRKKQAFRENKAQSLIHKSKGISTGRGYGDDMANRIISIYKSDYYGWNYSHFKDALEEDKQINVSISYITKLLRKNGIKSPKSKRQKKESSPTKTQTRKSW